VLSGLPHFPVHVEHEHLSLRVYVLLPGARCAADSTASMLRTGSELSVRSSPEARLLMALPALASIARNVRSLMLEFTAPECSALVGTLAAGKMVVGPTAPSSGEGQGTHQGTHAHTPGSSEPWIKCSDDLGVHVLTSGAKMEVGTADLDLEILHPPDLDLDSSSSSVPSFAAARAFSRHGQKPSNEGSSNTIAVGAIVCQSALLLSEIVSSAEESRSRDSRASATRGLCEEQLLGTRPRSLSSPAHGIAAALTSNSFTFDHQADDAMPSAKRQLMPQPLLYSHGTSPSNGRGDTALLTRERADNKSRRIKLK